LSLAEDFSRFDHPVESRFTNLLSVNKKRFFHFFPSSIEHFV